MTRTDAVVIGAGPNGLVGANLLADAGWSVLVLEANDAPGGGVRTAEVTLPGFRNDLCSAFYPLAMVSPALRSLHLEDHGLVWMHAPTVLAHPRPDGPGAVMKADRLQTAACLDLDAAGDGDAYLEVCDWFDRVGPAFMEALLSPLLPVSAGLKLAARAGPSGVLDLARLAVLPLRRFVEERFRGESARLLFAGNALHADFTPEAAGSALFGWILTGLAQQVGFPTPQGGAGQLTAALVARLEAAGGRVRCGTPVGEVVVRGGRAVGVRTEAGEEIDAGRAVLADCDATRLYTSMLPAEVVPPSVRDRLRFFQRASGTVKADWAVDGKIPWTAPGGAGAGVVHVAYSLDEMTRSAAQLATSTVPDEPFLLVGQMTTADPSRSPAGTESVWAYTHVPQGEVDDPAGELEGDWGAEDLERFGDRMERRIERLAPGFRDRILARRMEGPHEMERGNRNLVGGDVNGGTAQLHQQLVFRPLPGSFGPRTPVRGLYLASASAHPGGGVHGACGANAARAALARQHRDRRVVAGLAGSAAMVAAVRRRR